MSRLILMLALLLTACSSITAGHVVDKEFSAAHDSTMIMPIRTGEVCSGGYGSPPSPRICTPIYTYLPITTHHPDTWTVIIEGHRSFSDDLERRTIEVDKRIFDSLRLGDWYTVPS